MKYLLCVALVGLVACAPKTMPPNVSKLYTTHEVLLRVQELQRTVISLHDSDPTRLSKVDADRIVLFTTSSAEIIQASVTINTSNWQQVIKTSWMDLKRDYTPTLPELKVIWNFADQMIMSLSLDNPPITAPVLNQPVIEAK